MNVVICGESVLRYPINYPLTYLELNQCLILYLRHIRVSGIITGLDQSIQYNQPDILY